jgi:hypothetical protein
MNGELSGRFAAGHRARSDLVPAVSLIVVAIHRRFFAFCAGVMMGRDGAMVAGTTYAAGYGQSRNDRTLQQQGREEANQRRHAAAREQITEMAGELHSDPACYLSYAKTGNQPAPKEHSSECPFGLCRARRRTRKSVLEQFDRGDLERIALDIARDVHAEMILLVRGF